MSNRAPMIGHFYTMSAMKHRCGDRSWCHDLWEVLEANGSHVLIRNPAALHDSSFGFRPMVVRVDEFDWTPADEFAEHMKANASGTSAGTAETAQQEKPHD